MGVQRGHSMCCGVYSVVYNHTVLGSCFSANNDFFHRTTEYFGLEGSFEGHVVQAPCNELGHQLCQVVDSPLALLLISLQRKHLVRRQPHNLANSNSQKCPTWACFTDSPKIHLSNYAASLVLWELRWKASEVIPSNLFGGMVITSTHPVRKKAVEGWKITAVWISLGYYTGLYLHVHVLLCSSGWICVFLSL